VNTAKKLQVPQMILVSCPAEQQLASQKGLCWLGINQMLAGFA
jgi:hypothetical protein